MRVIAPKPGAALCRRYMTITSRSAKIRPTVSGGYGKKRCNACENEWTPNQRQNRFHSWKLPWQMGTVNRWAQESSSADWDEEKIDHRGGDAATRMLDYQRLLNDDG